MDLDEHVDRPNSRWRNLVSSHTPIMLDNPGRCSESHSPRFLGVPNLTRRSATSSM